MQPPAYIRQTNFANEEATGVAGRSTVRTGQVDAELNAAKATLDAILANLSIIQRDDTALRDGIVTLPSLSASIAAIFATAGSAARGQWLTLTVYALRDVVTNGTGTYLCAVVHTSGVFATDLAAGKWILIFDSANNAAALSDTTNAANGDALIGYKRTFGSAVASTLHAWHENQPAHVKADAGAANDGVTDITTKAQAALDSGRTVIFEEGGTFLTQGLTVNTAGQVIIIRGAIKLKNATNQSVFTVNAHRVRFLFQGGEIDGNKANQTAVTDATGSGIWLANGVNYFESWGNNIHDCRRNGIAGFGNHNDCVVLGGEIKDCGYAQGMMCIYPSQSSGSPCKRWLISGLTMSGFTDAAVGTVGIQNSVISGNRCVIANTGINGPISCIALEAGCHFSSIFGNTCEGAATVGNPYGSGIQVNDSHHVSVQGNTIKGCNIGITLQGAAANSYAVSVVGNTMDDCGYFGWALQVVPTDQNTKYRATIANNTINNSPYGGIALWGASYCIVTGNHINGVNLQNTASKRFVSGITIGNQAYFNTVTCNVIEEGATGNMKIGIHEDSPSLGNDAGNTTIRDNRIIGADYDIICGGSAYLHSSYSKVTRVSDSGVTAAPSTGHWEKGQSQLNEQPTPGDFAGWVCTASGTFGATAPTGTISLGTPTTLTLSSAAGIYAGMKIRVAGAGVAAGNLDTYVRGFDGTGLSCTITDAASTAVAGAAVTLLPPTFERVGQITLSGSAVYDPPNLVDGAGATTTVTVTGAALGDYVSGLSFSLDLQGITVTGWVSALNTVSVRFQNESGGALDLASGTLRARVSKQ